MADATERILDQITLARDSRTTLTIAGHGSKAPLLGQRRGDGVIDLTRHHGILTYHPAELVITARAGTPLADVNAALVEQGQCLAADPPCYQGRGTLGGAVAAGISGPSRPFRGSLRDSVLGVGMVNGLAERMRFGGEVFKNVAGFDVARLLSGSEGALGVLLSVSLRVAPVPQTIVAFCRESSAAEGVILMRKWTLEPLPLTGLAWSQGKLHWRLAGTSTVVAAARKRLGGDEEDPSYWPKLRDRELPCLGSGVSYRVVVAPATHPDDGDVCIDWAGGLRWRSAALAQGQSCPVGQSPLTTSPVDPLLLRIKQAFDPGRIFNPELLRANAAA
ncbi:MAG: glycolate oxidase subunit GlcE [Gammaproteobacteria bacterium]|nr:glycolate oxidase subunit GlcE [Gammaproteobacteria bacterium]